MTTTSQTPRRRRRRRTWSRERVMLLLGLPLVFAALVFSVGLVEYRPEDEKPKFRDVARSSYADSEPSPESKVQSRYLLDDSALDVPRPGPKPDLWMLEPELPELTTAPAP